VSTNAILAGPGSYMVESVVVLNGYYRQS